MTRDITDSLRLPLGSEQPQIKPTGPLSAPPDFSSAVITAKDLSSLELEQRQPLLGAWMKQGDFGYLFAPRGAGKSWMAMLIGNAIAEGLSLGEWQAGEGPRSVYYFDAEMNLADVQERMRIIGITSEKFFLLSNERLFLAGGRGVNIADPLHQTKLSEMLPEGSIFIIDNLSTAQLGMAENDNDSFDDIRDWLLSLRHRGITVIIIHHAGRNGAMRGSSRREDIAHWIISLKDDSHDEGPTKAFTTTFVKVRNCRAAEAMPLRWQLKTAGGLLTLDCSLHNGPEALLSHIREGVTSATELAEMLGVQAGTVSKWAKKLIEAGKISKVGREYRPIS